MQYILDCVTLLLNVVLCFYLLYGKYPVRSTHMVKRILLITAAVISKALIVYLQISPLNFISGCCIILLIIWLLFSCNKAALFMYTALFAMLTLSADALGVIVVSAFHQNTISITLGTTALVWQHHIWNWILQIVLTRIAKILIRSKEQFKIRWHEVMFYVLVVLFEVGIFAYFSATFANNFNIKYSSFVLLYNTKIPPVCIFVIIKINLKYFHITHNHIYYLLFYRQIL